MKVVFYESEAWHRSLVEKSLKGHEVVFVEDDLDVHNVALAVDADVLCVFIYSEVNRKVLSQCKNLKAVVTRSTGFDHIDLKECKNRKVKVFNVPHYGENTVAEHTFALMLSLSRKILLSCERTRRGNFSLDGLEGFDLKGKTLGIVGFGAIGKHVARMAKGFEMNLLVSTPHRHKHKHKHKYRKFERTLGVKFCSLDFLLRHADIISLHCPYNKWTHHLINGRNIHKVKQGAVIVNTARGGLINTKAMIKALAKGRLGGVALDVLEEEELIKEEAQLLSKKFSRDKLESLLENHLLLTFDNVLITPHNAFNSREALYRILDRSLENVRAVVSKKHKYNRECRVV